MSNVSDFLHEVTTAEKLKSVKSTEMIFSGEKSFKQCLGKRLEGCFRLLVSKL